MVVETLSHKLDIGNNEDQPNPQSVGSEFVKQYYTTLSKAPELLFRFYTENSSFVHGGIGKDDDQIVIGQKAIYKKIQSLNFADCRTKIRKVDSHPTVSDGIVLQVSGEISNNGGPMRRFNQTFVLGHQKPRRYYVINDIFRYQDEVFEDPDESNLESANQNRHDTNVQGAESHMPHILHNNSGLQSSNMFDHGVYSQSPAFQNQHILNHISEACSTLQPSNHMMNGSYQHNTNQEDTYSDYNKVTKNHLDQQNKKSANKFHSFPDSYQDNNDSANFSNNRDLVLNENGIDTWNSDDELVSKLRLESDDKMFIEATANDTNEEATPNEASNKELENKIQESINSGTKTYAQLLSLKSQFSTHQSIPSQINSTHSEVTSIAPNNENISYKQANANSYGGVFHDKIPDEFGKVNSNMKSAYRNLRNNDRNESDINNFLKSDGGANGKTKIINNRLNENSNDSMSGIQKFRQPLTSGTPSFSSTHPDSHQIFVGNLPHTIAEDELKKFFSEFGPVVDVKINSGQKDSARRVPNYGFVIFSSPDPVKLLISEKPIMYKGHRLNVEEKKNPKKTGPGNYPMSRGPTSNSGPSQNFANANRNGPIRPGFHGGNASKMHVPPTFKNNLHLPPVNIKK